MCIRDRAMIVVDRELTKRGLKSYMLFPVHDELVLEVLMEEFVEVLL